jgi:hypothetical protein
MFIRYFVELPLPPDRVEGALLDSSGDRLPLLAGRAERRGERLLAEVGIGPGAAGPRKQVAVSLGVPLHAPLHTSVPMTWEPGRPGGLFPRLEGDLEIGALGQDRTQLALSGSYRPPLGVVGRLADRLLLHRVAEATVKDFVDRLAAELSAEIAGAPGPA